MSRQEDEDFGRGCAYMVAGIVVLVFLILGLSWIVEGNNFFLYKEFAPANAAVQRQVFEQSPSYINGMIQNLQKEQFEYQQSTPDQQKGLASIIISQVAGFDESQLPQDLRNFVDGLKAQRLAGNAPVEGK